MFANEEKEEQVHHDQSWKEILGDVHILNVIAPNLLQKLAHSVEGFQHIRGEGGEGLDSLLQSNLSP